MAKTGPAGLQINWEAIRALHAAGTHTFQQLADTFGVSRGTLLSRATRENWNAEKDMVQKLIAEEAIKNVKPQSPQRIASTPDEKSIIAIATGLANKENFRARIAGQVEKVLGKVSEFEPVKDDREADWRLTVLDKAERVGSRGYGLEEKSGVNVLINMNALQTSIEDIASIDQMAETESPELGQIVESSDPNPADM